MAAGYFALAGFDCQGYGSPLFSSADKERPMQLPRQQKLQFHRDGYLKIPGAVPLIMIDRALRAINQSLG